MNARNPAGKVGYKSPGRRLLAEVGMPAVYPEPCKTDPIFRVLLGSLHRALARLATLPKHTPTWRWTEVERRCADAHTLLQFRTTRIMNPTA